MQGHMNQGNWAVNSASASRATFIRRTYLHLGLAILAFSGLESLLLDSQLGYQMVRFIQAGKWNWLMILGGFVVVGWIARGFAHKVESRPMQYVGLGLYVAAQAVIFLPLLLMASMVSAQLLPTATIMTLLLFGGLTATAFLTRADFSILRGALMIGGFIALGLIVCSVMFGFELGLIFSGAMVGLAAIGILYSTSQIIHTYHDDQYVGAALELFASVALMFWYIIRILMIVSSRR